MNVSLYILAGSMVFSLYAHGSASSPMPLDQRINTLSVADHAATLKALVLDLQDQCIRQQGQQLLSSLAHIPVKETPEHAILTDQLKRCQLLYNTVKKNCTHAGTSDPFLKHLLCKALRDERTILCEQSNDIRAQTSKKLWDLYHHAVHEDFQQAVSPQGFIMGIILTVLVTSGGQAADKIISKQDKAKLKTLFGKITDLQKAFKAKEKTLATNTAATITNLGNDFKKRVKDIQQTLGAAENQLRQEIQYIQRLVNVSVTPLPFFLPGQTTLIDRRFGASAMNTPKNGYTWHNVWGASSDWAFDPALEGFVQRGIPPGTAQGGYIVNQLGNQLKNGESKTGTLKIKGSTTAETAGGSGTTDAIMAEFNTIFTEYFTTQQLYTIEVELTLFNNAFPFCAAIIFNKPRWLSGNPDRMYSYRFIGIYGESPKNIGIYGGQSATQAGAGLATTTTPLKGIIHNTDPSVFKKIYTFKPHEVDSFAKQPVTYVISIQTQESQFNVTVTKKGETQPIVSSPVAFNNPLMNTLYSWYAGIGFMAPGCQALFKINKPTELAYTQAQLNAFKAKPFKPERRVTK